VCYNNYMRNKVKIIFLLIVLIVFKLGAQDVKFSWSLGDIGWSYDFINKNDIADLNILKFNILFDNINVMISTSFLFGTNKNNREENEPFYNSFLPLEIIYSPFQWKYANISLYGRGSWENGYTGNVSSPNKVLDGFFGSAGFKIGFLPVKPNIFKYSSNAINIFSEYTTHNEYKCGINIDFLTILFIILIISSDEIKIEKENKYNK